LATGVRRGRAIIVVIGLVVFYTVRLTTARNAAVAEAGRTQRIQHFMLNSSGWRRGGRAATVLHVVTLVDRAYRTQEPRWAAGGAGRAVRDAGSIYQKLGKLDQADSLLRRASTTPCLSDRTTQR